MPKYLFEASYSADAMKGIQSGGGSARREVVNKLAEGLGGRLESFHFAFGEHDAYVIVDLPDNESAAAIALTVGGSGAVSLNTVVLLTPEQVDAAAQKSVDYTPPGG